MFVFTPVQIHGGAFLYSLSGMTSRVAMRISIATFRWLHTNSKAFVTCTKLRTTERKSNFI